MQTAGTDSKFECPETRGRQVPHKSQQEHVYDSWQKVVVLSLLYMNTVSPIYCQRHGVFRSRHSTVEALYSLLVMSILWLFANARPFCTLSCGEMLCSTCPTIPPGSTTTCERSTRVPSFMELPK